VLTHLPLLKPALQAWWVVWGVSERGAYAPGSAEIGPSGLVRASVARCGFRGVAWASEPRFFGSPCLHSPIIIGGSDGLLLASRKPGIPCDAAAECHRQHPISRVMTRSLARAKAHATVLFLPGSNAPAAFSYCSAVGLNA